MARLGDLSQDLVGVVQRRRHQFRRFAAGVAEHDALVASPLVLVAGGVDALRDIGGLGVQQHFDLGVAPVEAVLLVADVLDRLAGGRARSVVGDLGPAHLAGDDHPVGRGERLAGDANLIGIEARLCAFAKEQIDDLIGNPVANLVGMPFGHGFTGELVILTSHIHDLLPDPSPVRTPSAQRGTSSRRRLCQRSFDTSSRFRLESFFLTNARLHIPPSSAGASDSTRWMSCAELFGSRMRVKARLSLNPSVVDRN